MTLNEFLAMQSTSSKTVLVFFVSKEGSSSKPITWHRGRWTLNHCFPDEPKKKQLRCGRGFRGMQFVDPTKMWEDSLGVLSQGDKSEKFFILHSEWQSCFWKTPGIFLEHIPSRERSHIPPFLKGKIIFRSVLGRLLTCFFRKLFEVWMTKHWIPGQPGADLFSCGKDNHQGGFRLESVHSSLKCMQFAYLRFSFLCQDFRLMGHRKWWKPVWMQKKPANMRNCCLNHSYKTDATQTPPGNVLSFVSTCCPLGLPKTGWSCCAVLPKRRATDYTSCKLKYGWLVGWLVELSQG